MADWTNETKAGEVVNDQELLIGEGFSLLIGDGFNLLIQEEGVATLWTKETKS